jgi:hypothetical protein
VIGPFDVGRAVPPPARGLSWEQWQDGERAFVPIERAIELARH